MNLYTLENETFDSELRSLSDLGPPQLDPFPSTDQTDHITAIDSGGEVGKQQTETNILIS